MKKIILLTYKLDTNLEKNNTGGFSKSLNNCINKLNEKKIRPFIISNNQEEINSDFKVKNLFQFLILLLNIFFKRNKNHNYSLVVFGCANFWPYFACIVGTISGMDVFFQPSVHDKKFVLNKNKALLAQYLISFISKLPFKKLKIIYQTYHEYEYLKISSKEKGLYAITVDLKKIITENKNNILIKKQYDDRENLILYIGRATKQKGWDKFLKLIEYLPPESKIIVVTPKKYNFEAISLKKRYSNIKIKHNLTDKSLIKLIKKTKIMFLASDYESLGITHIEATLLGCFVPLLGRYPFWDDLNIIPEKENLLLNEFIKNKKGNKEIINNIEKKIDYIKNKNLDILFDNFINSLI